MTRIVLRFFQSKDCPSWPALRFLVDACRMVCNNVMSGNPLPIDTLLCFCESMNSCLMSTNHPCWRASLERSWRGRGLNLDFCTVVLPSDGQFGR
jgi:hypothetical protein